MREIAIYGASGALGRRVTRHLVDGGAPVRVAARDAGRLDDALRGLPGSIPRAAIALDNREGLRRWLAGSGVVINAGPTASDPADRVLQAAIDAGTHYIDVSGSQPYIARLFVEYGDHAAKGEWPSCRRADSTTRWVIASPA
jgi:short subunit dehydrogenase-like uncharacterized protein